jgi:hypothetical protein
MQYVMFLRLHICTWDVLEPTFDSVHVHDKAYRKEPAGNYLACICSVGLTDQADSY